MLEIVAGVVDISPLEPQPCDVLLDRIYIFHVLFDGVGIIETEVADAVVTLCNTKVHTDGLDVSDMEVSVGFGRETRLYASVVLALCEVFLYNLLNKIEASFFFHSYLILNVNYRVIRR